MGRVGGTCLLLLLSHPLPERERGQAVLPSSLSSSISLDGTASPASLLLCSSLPLTSCLLASSTHCLSAVLPLAAALQATPLQKRERGHAVGVHFLAFRCLSASSLSSLYLSSSYLSSLPLPPKHENMPVCMSHETEGGGGRGGWVGWVGGGTWHLSTHGVSSSENDMRRRENQHELISSSLCFYSKT